MALGKNMVYDKETGKKRMKDKKAMMAAKKAARKRRGKPLGSATKAAIRRGILRAMKTGKTAAGRKAKF